MLISLLLLALFGAVVGWIAGFIMKSRSGLFLNIILGIIGSIVGGFVASLLGFGNFGGDFSFNLTNILIAVGGACLIILLARALSGGKRR